MAQIIRLEDYHAPSLMRDWDPPLAAREIFPGAPTGRPPRKIFPGAPAEGLGYAGALPEKFLAHQRRGVVRTIRE